MLEGSHGSEEEADALESSLVSSLGDSQLIDAAADAAEQTLDNLLSDGVLKDIPVLGHALKLWKGSIQLSTYLFARKLLRFLAPLNSIPQEVRYEFLRELEADPEKRKRVGEHLLLLLDRMDDLNKPEFLSKAFAAYISGRISYHEFRQLGFAIDRCTLDDLLTLCDQVEYRPNFFDEGIGASVYGNRSDACDSRLVAAGVLFTGQNGLLVTEIGGLLRSYVLPRS
jgi:hypothetical protein